MPINVRFAKKATVIPRGGGPNGQSPVLLRKGTGIGSSVYHLHRRTDLYGDDADQFRPERWERDQLANIGWGYMPFLGGPRQCLGSKSTSVLKRLKKTRLRIETLTMFVTEDYALMEASCAVVRILQTFPNIRLPSGHIIVPTGQERQDLTIVVSSADGCKVKLD